VCVTLPGARVDACEWEQDDDSDDCADDAAEVEDLGVADAEPDGEDQVADDRSAESECQR
jgi:hypothetical protein